jgi:type VI secretion system secreted protein Hcp
MPLEIFLKLDGVQGESSKQGHTNEIEIMSCSSGASNSSNVAIGTGSGTGKAQIHDFQLTKPIDSASPKLFQYCCNGKHIDTGKITFRKSSGDDSSPLEYLTYDLQEVYITSVNDGGGSGSDSHLENFSISAVQVVKTYLPQNSDGSAGTKQVGGWNQAKNAAAAGS